jgi:hypothetical protein
LLGRGIDREYPRANAGLARRIVESGLPLALDVTAEDGAPCVSKGALRRLRGRPLVRRAVIWDDCHKSIVPPTGRWHGEGRTMKKMVVLAVAAFLLAAVVPANAAARHTLPHRVSALEGKVRALQTRVNRLNAFTHNCLGWDWVAIGWFGDANETFGYTYDPDGAGAQTPFFTTALDVATSRDTTFFYAPAIRPRCLRQVAARTTAMRAELDGLSLSDERHWRARPR